MPRSMLLTMKLVVIACTAVAVAGCATTSQVSPQMAELETGRAAVESHSAGQSVVTAPGSGPALANQAERDGIDPGEADPASPSTGAVGEGVGPVTADSVQIEDYCQSQNECTASDVGFSTGTAFFVSDDGYALTNHHVVDGAIKIGVLLGDEIVDAEVIDQSRELDLALIKLPVSTRALTVNFGEVDKGEDVAVLGYPNIGVQGNEQKATFGFINAHSGIQNDTRYYQMSAPIQPGNSGSPMLNNSGEVVGVVTATLNQAAVYSQSGSLAQNVNYALKTEYAVEILGLVPTLQVSGGAELELSKAELVAKSEESIVLVVVLTEGLDSGYSGNEEYFPTQKTPESGAYPSEPRPAESGESVARNHGDSASPANSVQQAAPEGGATESKNSDMPIMSDPEQSGSEFQGIYQQRKSGDE